MNNINNIASHIKEKNIIPNIRRFVTNELGENYWLHGCLRYVMEALGEPGSPGISSPRSTPLTTLGGTAPQTIF